MSEPRDKCMSEKERDLLSEKLGDGIGAQAKRRKEIEEMGEEDIQAEIKKTEESVRERVEASGSKNQRSGLGSLPLTMDILCLVGEGGQVDAFTAYDCSNKSNIVESYSLLEPDACAVSVKTGDIETAVYGGIVQIKQDQIVPIFRCQVIETIVSQYCGHWSSAGITRYIQCREPKALEAWECRQARAHGKVVIAGRTVQATIGASMSHTMFLSGAVDDDSNCEAKIISFPNGKTLSGQAAQGLYEITLREEFARLNELTGSITLTSGVQARVSDKSLVDSLEGTVVWEYDSMACLQTIVQLYKGSMKVYTNQSGIYEGGTAVGEHRDKDQAAGLEMTKCFILCGHQAF